MKNFRDYFFAHKIDKRGRHEAYSYIGARMSESDWLDDSPSVSMVRLATQLAWEGHLPSVMEMELENMDLSDIPRDQIGELASIVTDKVDIDNITPATHLDIILERVRCPVLWLYDMSLTEPQTRALITAMRDKVEDVWLRPGVTLDIEALCQYNGLGTCRVLMVYDLAWYKKKKKRRRHEERLRRWTEKVGWEVTSDDAWLRMERK